MDIKKTQIFIHNHIKPIEVIIVGAVHIAQYLIDFLKNLNFIITIIDPEMIDIIKEEEENVYEMFKKCVEEEKEWAEYLFKDGSIIGLNDKLLQN